MEDDGKELEKSSSLVIGQVTSGGEYLISFLVIALHLHALTKVHQTLVDLSCLSKRSPGSLCVPRTLGSCNI